MHLKKHKKHERISSPETSIQQDCMKTKENHNEIRSLYERYASMVHRRCRTFLKTEEDAWDATQEVFMKLVDALPKINKKSRSIPGF